MAANEFNAIALASQIYRDALAEHVRRERGMPWDEVGADYAVAAFDLAAILAREAAKRNPVTGELRHTGLPAEEVESP